MLIFCIIDFFFFFNSFSSGWDSSSARTVFLQVNGGLVGSPHRWF